MTKKEFIEEWADEIGNNPLHFEYVKAFIKDLGNVLQTEREGFVQIVEIERQNTILSIDDVRTTWINQMCDRLTKTIRKLK